jgi:hypothetical protein
MENRRSDRRREVLMQCPACGSQLAPAIARCPRCGAPPAHQAPLVHGIPVIPLAASTAGPPAAPNVPLAAHETPIFELPAARFRGYRPVMPLPPLRRRRGGRMRAALAGLALAIVLVAVLAIAFSGLRLP